MAFQLSPDALLKERESAVAGQTAGSQQLHSQQTRLGVWIVLGNGVALFTLAQGIFSGHLLPDAWFSTAFARFTVGIAVAFVTMGLTYFFNFWGMIVLGGLSSSFLKIADAQTRIVAPNDPWSSRTDIKKELDREEQKLSKVPETLRLAATCMIGLTALHMVAGALFIWGLMACLHMSARN